MQVCVVGLGKIGLPLAAQLADSGLDVVGCDVDPCVVAAVSAGTTLICGEQGLAEAVARAVAAGRLRATCDTAVGVCQSDVVVVVVPLVIDNHRQPDYGAVDAASRAVASGLHKGQTIIYETTVPVGTTRRRFGKALAEASGLQPGRDFWLAFSPERVYSGRVLADLRRYPKIVGGVDPASTARAADFYRMTLGAEIIELASSEQAEFVKLIETTYRDVNIALANEFARYADELGLDVTVAIRAANTQPFSHIHWPGVGVGGHCIPVYPYLLLAGHNGHEDLRLVPMARQINDEMAVYAAKRLEGVLTSLVGRSVLILGWAYRENVKEAAFSSAKALVAALQSRGASVFLNDPLFSRAEIEKHGVRSVDLSDLPPVDAVVIQAYHDEYRALDVSQFDGCRVILDGRNVLDPQAVTSRGIRYLGIGR